MIPTPAAALRRTQQEPRRLARIRLLVCAVSAVLAFSSTAFADARTDYLVRTLRTSEMFRVRVQAAISLGSVRTEPSVIEALTRALGDDHPAVRAAAASALGRQGDPRALSALRGVSRDREAAVRRAASRAIERLERVEESQPRTRPVPPDRSADARFYVAIGRPGTQVRSISRDTLDEVRAFVERHVRSVAGVEIAPANERTGAANRAINARNLVGYYLDCSIVEVQERPDGVRVRVSVVVQTYPGRSIQSMLSGAATTTGRGDAAVRQAIEGALQGALRGLPTVMNAGARSAQARR